MKSHNFLGTKDWTVKFRPWIVIYCEYYSDKSEALRREKELKGGQGRKWIHDQIDIQFIKQGFISA
jgi:putative endonuclease